MKHTSSPMPVGQAGARPPWMTLGCITCALTLVISVVRDLFIPESRAIEVWFGIEIEGPLALATAPVHWAIFGFGAWAFWAAKPWVGRVAAGYLVYAALAHLVWSETSMNGRGWKIGLLQAAALSCLSIVVLRAKSSEVLK